MPDSSSNYPTCLCFGDSLTANGGWIDLLQKETRISFINAGRSGRQARFLGREFPPVWETYPEASHLILFLGINDLPSRDPRPERIRVEEALDGLRGAIELALRRIPPKNIFLITPAGVFPEVMSAENQRKGYPDTLLLLPDYVAGMKALAGEQGVEILTLCGKFAAKHFRDGLHLNEDGESRMAELLQKHWQRPSLYWVGDSISIDYHPYLVDLLKEKFHYSRKGGLLEAARNLDHPTGANGGDSVMVLQHLEEMRTSGGLPADYLVINCGLHDIKRKRGPGQTCQVERKDYRANLEAIVCLVREAGKKLIWVTTTPVDEVTHDKHQKHFERREADHQEYQSIAAEVMEKNRIPVLDLYGFTLTLGSDLFRDHVHFHPAISRQQAAFLAGELGRLFGE